MFMLIEINLHFSRLKHKAVFLDRDGTINIDKGYLYKREDFEYTQNAALALKKLSDNGYLLIIVTNQSGIARGFYSEEDYEKLNTWMLEDMKKKGIIISATYHCPHHPEAKIERYRCICQCRKPGTMLFWNAVRQFDINLECSFAVGDKPRDLSICEESKCRGILISHDTGKTIHRYHTVPTLQAAVDYILYG